jgi:hypothetical protein
MRTIPYDPSRTALYHPGIAPTVLKPGGTHSEALLCAEAARLAYKRFESSANAVRDIETALGYADFEQVEFFDQQGIQAFAAASAARATTLVAFRGTTRALDDILTDFKTWPKNWCTGGKVHAGFCDAFEQHRAKLSSWLAAHPGKCLITGHSLGGALAALAASVFKPARLITYGAPRVGDNAFSATLAGVATERYVNCCDIIARVPPQFLGYRHGGVLHYIDHTGRIHLNPDKQLMSEDNRQGRRDYRQFALQPDTVKLRQLADHAPINYTYPIEVADEALEHSV